MPRRHKDPIPIPDESIELDIQHDNQDLQGPEPESESGTGLGAVVLHHLVTVLLLVLIVGIGTWAYLTFKDTSFFAAPSESERTVLRPFAISAQADRIRFSLEVYRRLYEKYPRRLDELVDEGLLQSSDLVYPAGRDRYVYSSTGTEYNFEVADGATKNSPEEE